MQAAWLLSVGRQVVQSLQDNAWNLAIAQQLPQLLLCALRHLAASVAAAAAAGALPDGAVARAYCLLLLQISRRQVGSRAEPGGATARPSPQQQQQQQQQHHRGSERGGERGGSERGAAAALEAAAPHRVQLSALVDQSTRNARRLLRTVVVVLFSSFRIFYSIFHLRRDITNPYEVLFLSIHQLFRG